MKTILFVGCIPPPIGGVTVLVKQLLDELKDSDEVTVKYLDIREKKILFLFKYLFAILFSDIVTLQFTDVITSSFYLRLFIIAKLFRKKIIVRGFGGRLEKLYEGLSKYRKDILKYTIFKANYFLCETKANYDYFRSILGEKTIWYSNSRPFTNKVRFNNNKALKFCFFGQIKSTKGIREIFYSSKELPKEITIDIYGPLEYDILENEITKLNSECNAKYMGCISPEKVIEMMQNYDVLLLPSYHDGEGYPGVILEAYNLGMPVISTNWRSIPEIVDNKSGILVTPKNIKELHSAILNISQNKELYVALQKGAYNQARKFDSKKWTNHFINLCKNI